jgi:hypothetical protein
MNPPTTGHEKLIHKVHSVSKKVGGSAHVVTSHSEGNAKNPVPQKKKLEYIKKIAHPDVHVSGSSKEHPSILHHAAKLHAAGHDHLHVVAGSDRKKEFHSLLHKYNGKSSAHGHYHFKSITVHSSGSRDPDSHGTSGVSGTKMRAHAQSGDHKSFTKGLPKALHAHKDEIMKHVKTHNESMDDAFASYIEEEWVFEALTLQQRIKRKLIMRRIRPRLIRGKKLVSKRKAPEKNLKQRSRKQAIRQVRKRAAGKMGANYNKLSAGAKMHVDKRVAARMNIVNRLAKKAMPTTRKSELTRLSKSRTRKESFEIFVETIGKTSSPHSPDASRIPKWNAPNSGREGMSRQQIQKSMIQQEKDRDKRKHDMMLDRARIKDARTKNQQTEAIVQTGHADKAVLKVDQKPHDNTRKDGKSLVKKKNTTAANDTKHAYQKKNASGKSGQKITIKIESKGQVTEQDLHSLYLKAEKGGYDFETILEVFVRGIDEWSYGKHTASQHAFNRVNSFVAEGQAYELDHDLVEDTDGDASIMGHVAAAYTAQPAEDGRLAISRVWDTINARRKKKIPEWGTDEATKAARAATPGETNENLTGGAGGSGTPEVPIAGVAAKRKTLLLGKKKVDEGLVGGAVGGAVGMYTGGPMGAVKGASIGSTVGDVAGAAAKVAGAAYTAKKAYDIAKKLKSKPKPAVKKKVEEGLENLDGRLQDALSIWEGRMPSSVIKHKTSLANLTDKEFHAKHGSKDTKALVGMARRHGYKNQPNHYVDRANKGSIDEASKLPPHLAKFFDKKGDLKPDAAKRVAKGKSKKDLASRTTDVTPKGYGPSEEVDVNKSFAENLATGGVGSGATTMASTRLKPFSKKVNAKKEEDEKPHLSQAAYD